MTADLSTRGEPSGTSITDADPRPHVVVLGAGFAGIAAVRALRKAPVRVTLVDRHSYSTFQPLLYQVATGALNPGDITYGARGFAAHTGARFRKGEVLTIDPETRTISLDLGPDLHYDYLVIANGVTTNYFGVPGAAENAYPIYTRAEALAVRDRMTGYLDHPLVLEAMTRAAMVIVPSRWNEPFGLTALEAMACGAPLIVSPRGGLPEVAGDAAIYADPDKPGDIAAAILALAADPNRRDALSAAGRQRASGFDTPIAAARLASLRRAAMNVR